MKRLLKRTRGMNTLIAKAMSRGASPAVSSHQFALRLPRGWPENERIYWHGRSSSNSLQHGSAATLAELPPAARNNRVHVWTPPAETVFTRTTLPTRSRTKIMQALPYALEEQLLDEPENLHFAYVRQADGDLLVGITARARLKTWVETLSTAGVRPASLCPAMLALPLLPSTWSLAFVDDEMWVRSGPASGFACLATLDAPPPMLLAALQEAAKNARSPQGLTVFRPPPAFSLDVWRAALNLPVTGSTNDFWAHNSPPAGLNLLQGAFAPSTQIRHLGRPLLPAAIMLAIWLVGGLIFDVSEWWRLRQQHRAHVAEMQSLFTKSFPESKTILDPVGQMQRNFESLQSRGGGPQDLLPLLTRVAPTLRGQDKVRVQSVKYAERILTLDITLPDYRALEAVKNTFKAANLDVEVLAANSRGSEVEGRLRIQPPTGKSKPGGRS